MICIHLGLPKAASTTLQQHLFATHSQIEFLGKGVNDGSESFKNPIFKTIAWDLPSCSNDAILETWRRSVSEIIEPALQSGRVPVLSDEVLAASNQTRLAMNIERVFGPSKVILIVRHPLRWVESYYIQRLVNRNLSKNRRPVGYVTLEDWITQNWNHEGRGLLKQLLSRNFLEPYVTRLGKQNVGVFMFEHLQSDPQGFIEAMCEFIGVDPVEGVRHAANKHRNVRSRHDFVEGIKLIHRSPKLTRLFRSASRRDRSRMIGIGRDLMSTKGARATVEIPGCWRARIEDLVRDDCNYLRQEFGLPVDEAGYPV